MIFGFMSLIYSLSPCRKQEVVRIKAEQMDIRLDEVLRPLPENFPITLPAEISEIGVSRDYLRVQYKCHPQETITRAKPVVLDQLGIENAQWMCFNANYNPKCPQRPGESGFMFECEPMDREADHLFISFKAVAPRNWLFLGIYTLQESLPLSVQEWKDQTPKARNLLLVLSCSSQSVSFVCLKTGQKHMEPEHMHGEMGHEHQSACCISQGPRWKRRYRG